MLWLTGVAETKTLSDPAQGCMSDTSSASLCWLQGTIFSAGWVNQAGLQWETAETAVLGN